MSNWRKIATEPNWKRSTVGKLWEHTGNNVAPSNEVTDEEMRRGTYLNLDQLLIMLSPYMSDIKSARVLNSGFTVDPHNSARYRFPRQRGTAGPLMGGSGSTGHLSNFLEFLAARSDVQLSRKLTKRDAFMWSVISHRVAYYLIQHTTITPDQAITIRCSVDNGTMLMPSSYVDVMNGMPVEWAVMRDQHKLENTMVA